ncbi:MAG: hypothetical protein JSU63_21680 [Phycisphaerales bacterium]|nr:MAG: hypothetical protein JSU63_21680 [Phycisphaerales bacterium]
MQARRILGYGMLCVVGASVSVFADGGESVKSRSRQRARIMEHVQLASPAELPAKKTRGNGSVEVLSKAVDDVAASFLFVPAANDDCANQIPISGLGPHAFDNTDATEELRSPTHELCALFGDNTIVQDVWYCWTAGPTTELVELATCDLTTVDSKVAVYDGCDCLPTDSNLVTCNDDACGFQWQSSVTFEAKAQQQYLVRMGTADLFSAPGGVGSFSITPVDLPCDGGAGQSCQAADQFVVRESNRTVATVADNFTPSASGSITEACWWGAYADYQGDCQGAGDDTFILRYYADNGGQPGALLAEFSQAALTPTLTVAGPVATGKFIGDYFTEYEYTATHAPVEVVAGGCYWLEISNTITLEPGGSTDVCLWLWEIGVSGDERALWTWDGVDPPVYESTDVVGWDQAFCLDVDLGDPGAACSLPPLCSGWVSDCCEDNSTVEAVGCSESACCEEVCLGDMYCCAIAWDHYCASDAEEFCGSLCADCPEGIVTWIDPPQTLGVMTDARQPRDINNAELLQGIDTIVVSGPAGTDAGGGKCWSLCETAAGSTANDIADVVDNGDTTFTVTLDRRITPGAVTKVTFTSLGGVKSTGTFISLPADSSADGVSNTADILSLIDCCLNHVCTPPFGEYSCDIDQSDVVNTADILRLIDLLNGAGQFTRAWNLASPIDTGICP